MPDEIVEYEGGLYHAACLDEKELEESNPTDIELTEDDECEECGLSFVDIEIDDDMRKILEDDDDDDA